MSQVIEDHGRQKQAHDLFPTDTPVSDFIASGERSPDLIKAIIESFCDHWAPDGAILGVFDSKMTHYRHRVPPQHAEIHLRNRLGVGSLDHRRRRPPDSLQRRGVSRAP